MNGNLVPKMQKEESFEYVDCHQSSDVLDLNHKFEDKDKVEFKLFVKIFITEVIFFAESLNFLNPAKFDLKSYQKIFFINLTTAL